jgi:hypothetical protein
MAVISDHKDFSVPYRRKRLFPGLLKISSDSIMAFYEKPQ